MTDWPTYEIVLPLSFNVSKFRNDTEQGLNNLWLLCLDDMPGIIRFKGVVTGHNVRVFIDIFSLPQQTKDLSHVMFVTTPHYQNLSAKQAADIVFWEVHGTKMYHDGKECTP
jgi:hypothetical protein